jgi:hypothetical protein
VAVSTSGRGGRGDGRSRSPTAGTGVAFDADVRDREIEARDGAVNAFGHLLPP